MRRHTTFPLEREAPDELLKALRDVDPTLDLCYIGDGVWVLGSVRPNEVRYVQAARMVRNLVAQTMVGEKEMDWPTYRQARLSMQGFSPIATYAIQGEPDSAILRDLLEREWNLRHRAEATFNDRADESEGIPEREAKLAELHDRNSVFARDRNFWRSGVTVSGRNPTTK